MTYARFTRDGACDPLRLVSRMTNLMVTAQTQIAYTYLEDAQRQASSQIEQITSCWPDSPARTLITSALESHRDSAAALERQLLTVARQRGGLAFARI